MFRRPNPQCNRLGRPCSCLCLCLGFTLLMVAGCGTYRLQGTVAQANIDQPSITVVARDDPRLRRSGLAGARVQATLDPDSMDPIDAGSTLTNGQGQFTLPIQHGAGFLIYDLYVAASRKDHKHAERIMALPSDHKRLLILLPPGKDQWKPRQGVLEETLEMGKPYMDGGGKGR